MLVSHHRSVAIESTPESAHNSWLDAINLPALSVVVFTGAGISTESGIPDFRGPGGRWATHPEDREYYSLRAFLADRGVQQQFWEKRHSSHIRSAEPNSGHQAIARLARAGILQGVITQNTDGLHLRTDIPPEQIVELHGNFWNSECTACRTQAPTEAVLAHYDETSALPTCKACSGVMRTSTIFTGEMVPADKITQAKHMIGAANLMIVVGSSLMVEPAGSLCLAAVEANCSIIMIGRSNTPYDPLFTAKISQPIGHALPELVDDIVTRAQHASNCNAPANPDTTPNTTQPERQTISVLTARFLKSLQEMEIPPQAQVTLSSSTDVAGLVTTSLLTRANQTKTNPAAQEPLPDAAASHEAAVNLNKWLCRVLLDPPTSGTPSTNKTQVRCGETMAHLVLAKLKEPNFLLTILSDLNADQAQNLLAVAMRLEARYPAADGLTRDLLMFSPGLSEAGIRILAQDLNKSPTPCESILLASLEHTVVNTQMPLHVLDLLPQNKSALDWYTVHLVHDLITACLARVESKPATFLPKLAELLARMSTHLSHVNNAQLAEKYAVQEQKCRTAFNEQTNITALTHQLKTLHRTLTEWKRLH